MDKQTLFRELAEKLAGMGIEKNQIQRQLRQFDEYLSTLNQDDYQKELQSLSDTDRAAANIAAVLRGEADAGKNSAEFYTLPNISVFEDGASEEAGEKGNPTEQDTSEIKTTAAPRRTRAGRRPVASDAETVVTAAVRTQPAGNAPKNRTGKEPAAVQSSGDTVMMGTVGENTGVRRQASRPEGQQTMQNRTDKKTVPENRPQGSVSSSRSVIRFSELDDEIPVNTENRKMFWILFAVTLPITLTLALFVVGLFAGAFLVLAGIIAVCLAGLVGLSAAGGCASLFGMVYGVMQTLSGSRAAGLYEFGFAVIIAGVTLFAGILLYNFAVRLMPIVIGWLFRFFRYTVNQTVKLFLFVRRECTGK